MKKVMTIAAGLLLTTSAFASTVTVNNNTHLTTDAFATKASAYDAGFDVVDSLEGMSQAQLRNELPVFADSHVRNLDVDSTKVVVEEFATADNGIQYRASVDVQYHYDAHEND